MTNHKPRVSIGLPVYNEERFVEETLSSIVAQTYTDFELIISDNASTDQTKEICRDYAEKDPRIRYYQNKQNLGAAWNYNYVFELSGSEYFKWATGNDVCDTEFLRRCVDGLDENPSAVLCYSKTTVIDEFGGIVVMEEVPLELDSPDVVMRFFRLMSPMVYCHSPLAGLIRSSILKKTRLIGKYLASDRCLTAELGLYGPFHEIPERLFFRRNHPGNVGTKITDLAFFDPSRKVSIVLPEWRVCGEHLYSIQRTSLQFKLKVRLVKAVLRWVFYRRKVFLNDLRAVSPI